MSLRRSIARRVAKSVMDRAGCRRVNSPYFRKQEHSGKRSFFAENWREAVKGGLK